MATPGFPPSFQAEIKSSLDSALDFVSKSPIMIGLCVLIINLGGRFLVNDVTRYDEKVLNNRFMKKLTIFAIAFLSTRNIKFSVLIVFLYTVFFSPMGLAYKIMKRVECTVQKTARLFQRNQQKHPNESFLNTHTFDVKHIE